MAAVTAVWPLGCLARSPLPQSRAVLCEQTGKWLLSAAQGHTASRTLKSHSTRPYSYRCPILLFFSPPESSYVNPVPSSSLSSGQALPWATGAEETSLPYFVTSALSQPSHSPWEPQAFPMPNSLNQGLTFCPPRYFQADLRER